MNRDNLPAHAKYGPSSMARIMACPGSVKLQEQSPPQAESVYAAEGTKAHGLCETVLLQEPYNVDDYDEEMVAGAKMYDTVCGGLLDSASAYGIEHLLVCDVDFFGTADCYALVDRTLHVIDYKYGAGVVVTPENNKQALTYAGLIFADREIAIEESGVDTVVLTIVQPRGRGEPVTHWTCDIGTVSAHMREADAAINSAKLANPPVALGDHCKFCTAKLICPAIKKAEEGVAQWDGRDIPPDEIDRMLVGAKAIEGKIKDLFAYAHNRIEAGERIPGWKLTLGRKTRIWLEEEKLIKWARRQGKMQTIYKKVLLSPTQASKVIDVDSLNQFIGSKVGKPTLKPSDAPGEAIESPMAGLAALGKRLS